MATREQVEQLLSDLVSGAVFEIPRNGVWRSVDAGVSYRRRQPLDGTWARADEKSLRVDKALLSSLIRHRSSLLAKFIDPGTGRIGNGLFELTGGLSTRAALLPEEFAKMLVVGAVRLGPRRTAAYLFDWIDGAPLRSRCHFLVDGIRIDQAIRLHGVELSMLAAANIELPLFLSHSDPRDGVPAKRIREAAVVSLDLEHQPALYRPDGDAASLTFDRLRTAPVNASLAGTSVKAFCEAMMLASGRHVPWLASWDTHGDVCAFMSSLGGGGSYPGNPSRSRGKAEFTIDQLASSVDICALRTQNAGSDDSRLNLAIRRWANSVGRPGAADKLIELRIALEALYARKGERSLAEGIALRGAWHLGRTFAERVDYRDLLRKAYADASNVIHAGEPKHVPRDKSLVERGQEACRQGILQILRSGIPEWDHMVLGKYHSVGIDP